MTYDAVVIGAGPGGYVAAIRLGQLGKRTLVVEKQYVGGVCLNVGCIPTKALIHAAHLRAQAAYAHKEMGVRLEDGGVDLDRLRAWKDGIVQRLVRGIQTLWKAYGVEWVQGTGRLLGPHQVEISRGNGEKQVVEAEYVILATGSRPSILPGFEPDGERIWTSDDAVRVPFIPRKLLVLGAGAIGLEFAYVYRHLGSEVEVFELMPQILPGTDAEMARELQKALSRQGIQIHTKARAKEVVRREEGLILRVELGGEVQEVEGEVLLLAVGRKPNSEGIGLEQVGLRPDSRGYLPVNARRQTDVPWIFAIGDLAGPPLLAHKASREGVVAAEAVAGLPTAFEPQAVPLVVYTEPQLASVGLSEEEARSQGLDIAVGRFPILANGRALTYGERIGLAKVIVDRFDDSVVGVHILAPEASSLIGEGALALEMGATAEDIGLTIHPHPTLSEILMEAAENVHKRAIHIVNR